MPLPQPLAPITLLALAFVFMPFGRMIEIPLGLLAIFGALCLRRGLSLQRGVHWSGLLALTLLFLTPMLLALPDAVALEKSVLTTLAAFRFPFFACALLWFAQQAEDQNSFIQSSINLLGLVVSVLLTLWCADALLQFVRGENILGYGRGEGYVNGIFGDDDNIKLGQTVAFLVPLGVVHIGRRAGLAAALLALLLFLSAVVLSGKRGAWVTVIVELFALAAYYYWRGYFSVKRLAGVAIVVAALVSALFLNSDWVKQRSSVLAQAAADPSYEMLYLASGKRLPIWSTAVQMAKDHWLNGVGPRGFRWAYTEYADPEDHWREAAGAAGGSRASHAHQLILELWSETGIFGLLSYVGILVVLFTLWRGATDTARARALPYAVALLGMLFPINTHAAWYSSWSAAFFWLFSALCLFALTATEAGAGKEREEGRECEKREGGEKTAPTAPHPMPNQMAGV
ncbi:MAG: O-antigen ligase family protein [Pseudomonadota bacterium]